MADNSLLNRQVYGYQAYIDIEERVIKAAKKHAQKKGRSLSSIVENYLKIIVVEEMRNEMTFRIRRLRGSIKLPADFNYKKVLEEALQLIK